MASLDLAALILIILALMFMAPVIVLLVEILSSFLKARDDDEISYPPARFAVIVPAHNEETIISKTILAILPQLSQNDRLVVVADNCTDETAKRAEEAGAQVIVRSAAARRGKGFALDFGVAHLRADPPDVVIIIDADCTIEPGGLAKIAALALKHQNPVQALYEMEPPPVPQSHTLYIKLATLAWRLKNHLRPLGLYRLGLPCQLMGTGMAFPFSLISKADLATSEIVEDLVLGLTFAGQGRAPRFCPWVRIKSQFPANVEGQETQRTRWETGHLHTIVRHVPSLMLSSLKRGNLKSFILGMDAAVPPLAFLFLGVTVVSFLSLILMLLGGSLIPLKVATLTLTLFIGCVFLCWFRVGKDIISITELGLAPAYAFSKIALYGRILIGRQIEWIRSRRD